MGRSYRFQSGGHIDRTKPLRSQSSAGESVLLPAIWWHQLSSPMACGRVGRLFKYHHLPRHCPQDSDEPNALLQIEPSALQEDRVGLQSSVGSCGA